jgi:hypothetical protein
MNVNYLRCGPAVTCVILKYFNLKFNKYNNICIWNSFPAILANGNGDEAWIIN